MNLTEKQKFRIAILDLYEGQPNQGMRCIRQIIDHFSQVHQIEIEQEEFEVRLENRVPDLSYDAYISTGGPGNPLESEGSEWELHYFRWLEAVQEWNSDCRNSQKKHVFFICHSFQLACRYWQLATVCARKSTSFGVFPMHLLEDGKQEPVFEGMTDPFYAVDSRDYQVIEPRMNILYSGAKILCIEKDRPHLPYERAIMAMRFSDYFIGTQFHPEADAIGMSMYLQTEEKKRMVINNHGEQKWQSMIEQLNDPDKIMWTNAHIIPKFLTIALNSLTAVTA